MVLSRHRPSQKYLAHERKSLHLSAPILVAAELLSSESSWALLPLCPKRSDRLALFDPMLSYLNLLSGQ